MPMIDLALNRRDFLPLLLQSRRLFQPNISFLRPDLTIPGLSEGPPRPGVRVRRGTSDLYHILYLPEDGQPGGRYPLIVEYPGNAPGPLVPRIEGVNRESGTPLDTKLGFGISGGREFVWLSLPFVDLSGNRIARSWWGDARDTVDYCRRTVLSVCSDFGGDPARILLCGFSRGSIACNYIGLYDDAVADLWRAFVCHSRRSPLALIGIGFQFRSRTSKTAQRTPSCTLLSGYLDLRRLIDQSVCP